MAMTRPDYDFLAKIMKEQLDASVQGSLGERIRMTSFRLLAARIDAQYLNFKTDRFLEAAGITRLEIRE